MAKPTLLKEPETLAGIAPPPAPPTTRTVTVVCEECETPEEISLDLAVKINFGAERCCRVCGEPFSRCPVGGV